MSDRDIIKQRWSKMNLKERLKYIYLYYKYLILFLFLLIGSVIFFLINVFGDKTETAFYVMVLECQMDDEKVSELERLLGEELAIDTKATEVVIETSYTSSNNAQSGATVSTYMKSGRVDLLIAPEEKFNLYSSTGYLKDLSKKPWNNLIDGISQERKFFSSEVDYSSGGAITEIPMNPHDDTGSANCYGVYLEEKYFGGYVMGMMENAPHESDLEKGAEFFLEAR